MQGDRLEDLLQQADRSASPPRLQKGLTARVLLRARRQAVRRRIVGGVLMLALVALGASRVLRPSRPLPRPRVEISTPNVAEIRAEFARLDREAAERETQVRELEHRQAAFEQLTQSQRRLQQTPDPYQSINEARNRAAMILFRQADTLAALPQNKAQSQRIYADTARLFPDTPAGQAASHRLPAG